MHNITRHMNDSTSLIFENATAIFPYIFRSPPSWVFHDLIPTLASVLCVCGLLGNGVVIFVMIRYPSMISVPNTYILNLASADFLYFLGVPFLTYFNTTRRWSFGDFMCKFSMGVDGMNTFTGIFTLTAMAIDRYFATVHAVFSTRFRCVLTTRVVCMVLWLVSIIVTLPLWRYASTETYDNVTVCSINCPLYVEQLFVVYSFLTAFVIPLTIIILCYLSILNFLANRRRNMRTRTFNLGRISVMVLTTVIFFFACWLPFWAIRIILYVSPSTHSLVLQIMYYCTPLLSSVNSCFNPVIYTWFKDDFRNQIKQCMCNMLCKRQKKMRTEHMGAMNQSRQRTVPCHVTASNTSTRTQRDVTKC
uniref:Somatostatin receptor type 5-like n=1 Tax=Saccoglossus kowalevskii TaxID=10224 RepID=A0ABM0MLR7_SACKO|nr:PREDICTED: somatostatin receptor type 5-like [Saccoglossus kowalevskii]